MFKCGKCGKVVPPGTRAQKLTVESREKVYPHRPKVFRVRTEDQKSKWRDDSGGKGQEIVREITVCPWALKEATEQGTHEIDTSACPHANARAAAQQVDVTPSAE